MLGNYEHNSSQKLVHFVFQHYKMIHCLLFIFHKIRRHLNGSNSSLWLNHCFSCKNIKHFFFHHKSIFSVVFLSPTVKPISSPNIPSSSFRNYWKIALQENPGFFSDTKEMARELVSHFNFGRLVHFYFSQPAVWRYHIEIYLAENMMNRGYFDEKDSRSITSKRNVSLLIREADSWTPQVYESCGRRWDTRRWKNDNRMQQQPTSAEVRKQTRLQLHSWACLIIHMNNWVQLHYDGLLGRLPKIFYPRVIITHAR